MSATSEAPAAFRHSAARPGPLALIREGIDEILSRRRLVRYLVQADIRKKGADTLLGNIWWVLDPLLQMVVYVVFVAIILQAARPTTRCSSCRRSCPGNGSPRASTTRRRRWSRQERLIKQIQFPKIVLPVAATTAGIVGFGFGLIALGVHHAVLHRPGLDQPRVHPGHRRSAVRVHAGHGARGRVGQRLLPGPRQRAAPPAAAVVLPVAGPVQPVPPRGRAVLPGQPDPARHRSGQPVRDPVRVLPSRDLRHAGGRPGAAELGRPRGAAGRRASSWSA